MSRTEKIEIEVKTLDQSEYKAFREWFARYDAEVWDRQSEAHAQNGRLLALAQQALLDHEQGRSTEV